MSLVEDVTEFVAEGYSKQASGAQSVPMPLLDRRWCQCSDAVFDGADECTAVVVYCMHHMHVIRWHTGAGSMQISMPDPAVASL